MSPKAYEAGRGSFVPDSGAAIWPQARLHARATIDEIDAFLFSGQPSQPEQVGRIEPLGQPEQVVQAEAGRVVGTESLMLGIRERTRAKLAAAEAEGMETPVLTIIGSQPWGETLEHLIDTAAVYGQTGDMPAPYGDTMSYLISLARRAQEAGIRARVYLPQEVLSHPKMVKLRESLGNTIEWPDLHGLGGVLDDMARPAMELRRLERRRRSYTEDLETFDEQALALHLTPEESAAARADLEADIARLDSRIVEIRDNFDRRLAGEDRKLASITAAEDANAGTSAIIAMMKAYTKQGSDQICRALSDNLKDIDGLHPSRKAQGTREWDEITAHAMWETAKHLAGGDIPPELMTLVGRGPLVGAPLVGIAGIPEDRIINGQEGIVTWAQNPGDTPIGVLFTAFPAAELVDARKITPAVWPDSKRKLIIVDGGVATKVNSDTKELETRSNVDLSTVEAAFNVEATNGVGWITAALAVERVVDTDIRRLRSRQAEADRVAVEGLEGYLASARQGRVAVSA